MSYTLKYPAGSREILMIGTHSTQGIHAYDLEREVFIDGISKDGIYREAGNSALAVFASPYSDFFTFLVFGSSDTFNVRSDTWGSAAVLAGLTSSASSGQSASSGYPAPGQRISTVCYPGTGTEVAIAYGGSTCLVDDFKTGARRTLSYSGTVRDVAWSEDGSTLAVVSSVGPYLYVYSLPGLAPVALTIPSEFAAPAAVAVSPSGRYVATVVYSISSSAAVLTLFDLSNGTSYVLSGAVSAVGLFFLSDTELCLARSASFYDRCYAIDDPVGLTYIGSNIFFPHVDDRIIRIKNSSCGKYILVVQKQKILVYHRATRVLYRTVTTTLQGYYDADVGMFGHSISNAAGLAVTDPLGAPIPGVKVLAIRRETGELQSSAVTDASGRYSIPLGAAHESSVIFQGVNANEGSVIVDRVIPE